MHGYVECVQLCKSFACVDFSLSLQSSLAVQLSRALSELENKSLTISDLCREAARTEEQANALERLLTDSQGQLRERERELCEMREGVGRREREGREERERLTSELATEERRREITEENVRQLQVRLSRSILQ